MANRVLLLKSFENHGSRIKSFISKFSCSLDFSPFDPVQVLTRVWVPRQAKIATAPFLNTENTDILPTHRRRTHLFCPLPRWNVAKQEVPELTRVSLRSWIPTWHLGDTCGGLSFSPVKRRWVAASVALGEKNSEGERFALLHPQQPVNHYRKHLRKASGRMTGEAARSTSSCENAESNSHSRYQRKKKEESWR